MIFLSIFLLLCIIEAVVIWLKWEEISGFISISKLAINTLGLEEKLTGTIQKVALFFIKNKKYAWIFVALILSANLFIAFMIRMLILCFEIIYSTIL